MNPLNACLSDELGVKIMSPYGVMLCPRVAGVHPSKIPVPVARELAREHHLLILRGFDSFRGPEGLGHYAQLWGRLLIWPFGAVLDLVEHQDPTDHVFDNTGVTFHWDGMFAEQVPEFQILHCASAVGDGQGGRTIFCDTTRVLADASPVIRALWASLTLTYRITKQSHYGGIAMSPLVVKHPNRGFSTMRYLEPALDNIDYLNRPRVEFDGVPPERVDGIEQRLRDALHDPRHCYAHSWQAGDVVIADNYTLLHGREAYASKCGRHLRRVHVLGDPPLTNPALR